MGTEVHHKSYLPRYYSMRDINEDSNSSSWSLYYGDKTVSNGQYYNGFMPRTVTDAYPGYEKVVLKQKMLEHEAIFKNQVFELHRLYRVQRDMMDDIKRKELYKHQISIEASSSSSLLPSQRSCNEVRNRRIPNFPLANSGYGRPSILGAEVIDESPLSCTIGNSAQIGRVPSQNKCTSEDCEVLESRPSKVRKKLFDLELPADDYIDAEEEQFRDKKVPDISSYPPSVNHRAAPENSVKLFLGGGKTDCLRDSLSDTCLRSSHGLADLNEPIQDEEATPPISLDFLGCSTCHGEIRSLDASAKQKAQFVDLTQEFSQDSQHRSINGNLYNLSVGNKGYKRGWLSYINEAGNSRSDPHCIPQYLQPDQLPVSSRPTQIMLDKAHQHPLTYLADRRREDSWTPRTGYSFEISDRSRDHCSYNHAESVLASCISSPFPYINSSDVTNSWSHSVTPWGKPNTSFTQKLTSFHTNSSFISSETLSRNSQPSAQTPDTFGAKWHANGSSRSNPGLISNLPSRNGFYRGLSSGSKERSVHLSSIGFDNPNCNKIDIVASENLINKDSKNIKGSNAMDLNLNVVLPENSFNEAAPPQGLEVLDGKRKYEDHIEVFPWHREKPGCRNDASIIRKDSNLVELGFLQDSCKQLLKNETMKDPNLLATQNVTSASSGRDVGAKREVGVHLSNRHIVGFPIFGNLCGSKNDSSSLVSTSASVHFPPKAEDIINKEKHREIDINVPCDIIVAESGKQIAAEALVEEEGMDTKANFRSFDLNYCISEEEDPLGASVASTSAKVKVAIEIDLEAPVILETEEAILLGEELNQHEEPLQSPHHKAEQPEVEIARVAADALVAISSDTQDHHMECIDCNPSEASLMDSLLWFAELISSSVELESKICKKIQIPLEEMDDFEAMTLQLTETKEEDYMPKPFVPEIQEMEETGATSLPNRTRKGQARRGRPRRDFQRDILPGLASLSRHEVTEDLQTFGGLMRATGHSWNSGLTRRNGTRSGRRRCAVDPTTPTVVAPVCTSLMQQLNNIEVGLEERSLTGWGKTTRRPRRQRCPAGNNLAAALS